MNVQQGGFVCSEKIWLCGCCLRQQLCLLLLLLQPRPFADIYYIGNGSIDVVTKTGTDGEYVEVTQNGKTYTDTSKEIVIKDGTSEKDATLKEAARAEVPRQSLR